MHMFTHTHTHTHVPHTHAQTQARTHLGDGASASVAASTVPPGRAVEHAVRELAREEQQLVLLGVAQQRAARAVLRATRRGRGDVRGRLLRNHRGRQARGRRLRSRLRARGWGLVCVQVEHRAPLGRAKLAASGVRRLVLQSVDAPSGERSAAHNAVEARARTHTHRHGTACHCHSGSGASVTPARTHLVEVEGAP